MGGYRMSKKGTILKELDDGLMNVSKKIKEFQGDTSSEQYRLYRKQLMALQEIDSFVSKYEWVGTESAKEKIKAVRESYYDYNLIKEKYGLSKDGMKGLMYRLNQKLEKLIGEDTIDLILSRYDKVAFGIIQFRICSKTYSLDKILLNECYTNLLPAKLDLLRVEDCLTEIEFLYTYSLFGMQEKLKKCNSDRLAFLKFILENSTERYKQEQKDIISMLQGVNVSFSDYIRQLQGDDFIDEGRVDLSEMNKVDKNDRGIEESSELYVEDNTENLENEIIYDDELNENDEANGSYELDESLGLGLELPSYAADDATHLSNELRNLFMGDESQREMKIGQEREELFENDEVYLDLDDILEDF